MKYDGLFLVKSKKNVISLSSAKCAQRMLKAKHSFFLIV